MDTKEYIEKQELQKQKELKEYLQSVEDKKKDIKNFVKKTIATGLVFGSILTGTACGIKNPNNQQTTTNPNQTTTLDTTTSTIGTDTTGTTTSTETTTSGQTETTTSTETTTTPPIVDKKQETINKFLTLLDEMAERNGVDEIRDILLRNKNHELAKEPYYQLSFADKEIIEDSDILEYYIINENDFKSILSSMRYNFVDNYPYHFSKEKLISKYKNSSLDIINEAIETKERYNEDNPYKYEIDYEKKKEKDLAEFNEFLAKVSAEHGGKNVETFEIQKVDDSFRRIIFYYKKAEGVYINLRYYGVDEQLYSKFVEKFHLNQQGVVSISVKDIVDNYESEFFDELLNTLRTHLPVINPKTMEEKER